MTDPIMGGRVGGAFGVSTAVAWRTEVVDAHTYNEPAVWAVWGTLVQLVSLALRESFRYLGGEEGEV